MTVSRNSVNRVDFVASDGQTVFGFSFKYFVTPEIRVFINRVELTSGFTVTPAVTGVQDGGTITLTTGASLGDKITIKRTIALAQETEYEEGTRFPPQVVEDDFDRGRMIDQQNQEEIDRCLKLGEASVASNMILQEPSNSLVGHAVVLGGASPDYSLDWSDISFEDTIQEIEDDRVATETARDAAQAAQTASETARTEAEAAQSATEAVRNDVRQIFALVENYGAVGDGSTDDLAAFNTAIAAVQSSGGGRVILSRGKTYRMSGTLTLNTTESNAVGLTSEDGTSNEPVIKFDNGVSTGLQIYHNKSQLLKDVVIDMTQVTNNCVGVLCYGMWRAAFKNLTIKGPGGTNPSSGQISYGLALRPTQNPALSTSPYAVALETIRTAETTSFGVFWNIFEQLDVTGFGYGLIALGNERVGGGTRTNQNQFNNCRINGNYYNLIMDGCGGGNTFYSCTAEEGTGNSITVDRQSGGTSPVWIGGEIGSSGGEKWKGPGLLLNATAGTDFPTTNDAGQKGTHLRFVDGGPQLFGRKLPASDFIEGYKRIDYDVLVPNERTGINFSDGVATTLFTLEVGDAGASTTGAIFSFDVLATDINYRQGEFYGRYNIYVSNGTGSPSVSVDLQKEREVIGSGTWSSPVVAVTTTTAGNVVTVKITITTTTSEANGTIKVMPKFWNGQGVLSLPSV